MVYWIILGECQLKKLSLTAILLGSVLSAPAHAISISPTSDATGLANTLFLNLPGLQITDATLDGAFGQTGTFTNESGTYGLPNSGIVLSSGHVSDYADGPNTETAFTTEFDEFGFGGEVDEAFNGATPEEQALLGPISGQPFHFDVALLDISFNVDADVSQVSFFGTFGSEEFPRFVGSEFVDGFGLFVNGTNVAGVQPADGGPNLPLNVNHPDFDASITGTELNAVLAPNGNPVLRFDVPVNPGEVNQFQIIVGDSGDTSLDTTIYLSSFIAQGNPGDTGGTPTTGTGTTEFNPVLPSNPPDPETGEFVIALPEVPAGETVWIDPPVSVGFTYDAGTDQFASITAPSLATVADLDGYIVEVGGVQHLLAAGATLDFQSLFGETPTTFKLLGIDPDLGLDPANALAFPLGVSFVSAVSDGSVSITPITLDVGGGVPSQVPLPATGLLLVGALGGFGLMRRRKSTK
ncbi:VPLPA-CTERM sorting domain-containing protein [Epibacterium sp. SM1969]|uniref:VPLPA-CTERM sorting domain-containing protein n=1 Tax=Tritonibacter aquimaris TaxID=2663379 RepID=A0A844B068_9RHOB|nr:VPLPA-CTERM sorting domain-containing protein [Tritonibacter aquimaris]